MTFRNTVSGAVLLAMSVAAPVSASAETLLESLTAAYTSNPNILARRAYLRGIDEGVPIAEANWRPTVTFTADWGIGRFRGYTSGFEAEGGRKWSTRQPRSIKLAISQWLYRGGRTVAATKKADYTVLAERANLYALESQVLLDSATAYLNTMRDQAVLELNLNNEQVLKRQLEAAEDRFRVGEITRTDVAQAEARLAGAKADSIQAMSVLESSRAAFKKLMGYEPGLLEQPETIKSAPEALKEAQDLAAMYNYSVVAARNTAISAQHNIDLVRGELLPTLRLDATAYESWKKSTQHSWTQSLEAALTLTVPLYQAGNVYGRIREAKHTAGQRRIEVETNRREAVEAATTAWENLTTAEARVKSFKSQIVAAEVALEGVEREAQVGSRTILDVLDAEQELLNAKVSLVQAQRDVLVAHFQLLSATGNLTAEKLGLSADLYDPDAHYRDVHNQWIGSDADADVDEGLNMPEDFYYVDDKNLYGANGRFGGSGGQGN